MDIDSLYYLDMVGRIALALPQVEAYTYYATPAFHVQKKMLARFKEDGETLVVHAEEREVWMGKDPAVFFITDHYRNYPYVLVNLAKVKTGDLKALLEEAWKQVSVMKPSKNKKR